MPNRQDGDYTTSPVWSGVRLKCPKCGKASVYDGFLTIKKACDVCKFALGKHDSADGPAYIAMFLTGVWVTIAAFIVERIYEPHLWLHAALWIPSIFLSAILLLKWIKPVFVALQYKYRVMGFGEE